MRTIIKKSDVEMVEIVQTVLKDVAHKVVKNIDVIVTDEVTSNFYNSFSIIAIIFIALNKEPYKLRTD